MIKKILAALFAFCLISPVSSFGAELRITDKNALQKVLEMHLPNDKAKQAAVIQVYLNSLSSTGGKISTDVSSGLSIEMCKAAGFVEESVYDPSQDPLVQSTKAKGAMQLQVQQMPVFGVGGYAPLYTPDYVKDVEYTVIYSPNDKCKKFIEDVAWKATGLYYDVCGESERKSFEAKKVGQSFARCIKSFYEFQGQQLNGVGLAKEWAMSEIHNSQYAPEEIVCESSFRTKDNDDYISCKSLKYPTYYEFLFDDLTESNDDTMRESLIQHILWVPTNKTWVTTKQECDKVNKTAKKFNAKATLKDVRGTSVCRVEFNDMKSISQLRTACGIDNFAFMRGDEIQARANSGVESSVRKYIASKCGIKAEDVYCAYSVVDYKGSGGAYADAWVFDGGDDILTCWFYEDAEEKPVLYRPDGQPLNPLVETYNKALKESGGKATRYIDFVFDDLSENSDSRANAGQQAVQCLGADGEFDGSRCTMLGKEACEQLQVVNEETCPTCEKIYWDSSKGICTLGSAEDFEEAQKTIDVLITVGAVVVGVVVTVVSGGTALAVIGTSLTAVGGTTALVAESVTEADIDAKIEELNRCNEPKCAEEFLKKTLSTLNGLKLSMTQSQGHAADALVSKLIGLLPPDSEYLAKIIEGCIDPNGGDEIPEGCVLYERNVTASQIVGWVGRALEFIGGACLVVDGIMQWTKTSASIVDKVDDLKKTGWIREGNKWRHQTTGEIIDKLPREGVIGWDPHPNLRGGGRWRGHMYGNGTSGSFTKVAEVEEYIRMIDATGKAINLAEVAAGTYAAVDALSDQGYAGQYTLPDTKAKGGIVPVTSEPLPETKAEGGIVPVTSEPLPEVVTEKPVSVPEGKKAGVKKSVVPGIPDVVLDYDVEIEDEEIEVEDVVIDTLDDDFSIKYMNVPKSSKPVTTTTTGGGKKDLPSQSVKDPRKTGLIATAAVLGAVGTGLLVGGLVSRDKDDNAKSASSKGGNTKLEKDLETILNNSDKSLGFVNGNMIKLVPMNTVNGTNAKILNINGNAVAVVDYRGHRLPYYVNGQTGSWVPLLGIGKTGGWFNTYLSNTPPAVITQISNVLNQQLKPEIVAQFVGANALGVQFPMPMQTAYDVINAEFPGGVVETFNGVFSPSDQKLYNSNYQRIKNMFNMAAHLGGFFMGKCTRGFRAEGAIV